MSKIIEELAKQYAEYMCPIGDYCGGVYDEQRNSDISIYTDDARSVLNWLFDKPLASRLTAEEKERVREIYDGEVEHVQYQLQQANASMNQMCRSWHNQLKEGSHAKLRLLESIFGKEMFNENNK